MPAKKYIQLTLNFESHVTREQYKEMYGIKTTENDVLRRELRNLTEKVQQHAQDLQEFEAIRKENALLGQELDIIHQILNLEQQ
ncbi:hypothetical protein HPULCUR_012079 [Helicostylum pulchrum]|uniref:Uncharacterized protein n=1 Tax=Helicostylum pulchrum TaxID=562976 RepID=A0ABP9YI59_9FUNG